MKKIDSLPARDSLPVCVYCFRGTTSAQLVETWLGDRHFYAHNRCRRRCRAEGVPPEPLVNRKRVIPSLAERLIQWNALADEVDRLWAAYQAAPHVLATNRVARRVFNIDHHKTSMTRALADPFPDQPDEAGDHVRILRWCVEKLRTALDRDPSQRGPRSEKSFPAPDLRLPETVEAVRAAYKRRTSMVKFVAAPPGYTRLRYYCSESGESWVDRQPVLMWRIDGRLVASPVMLPGEPSGHDCLGEGVLLRRGGRVAVLGDKIYPNEKTWTRAMREAHAIARRRQFKTVKG